MAMVRIDNEIYEKIKVLANNDRRSIASYINIVLERLAEQEK